MSEPNHNPLPWQLVVAAAPGQRTHVVDADGATLLQCGEACTERDLGNLELIVLKVNGWPVDEQIRPASPEASAPSFTIHEPNGDEEIQPGIAGA